MKKVKTALLVALALILSGLGLYVGALAANGWKPTFIQYEARTFEAENEITALSLTVHYGTVTTELYDGDRVKIDYEERIGTPATVTEQNGTLTFTTENNFFFGIFQIFSTPPRIKIYLPRTATASLKIILNAGSCTVGDGNFTTVDAQLNAGTLSMGKIACDTLKLTVNAGTLTASEAITTRATVHLSAGSVTLNSLTANTLSAQISAGSGTFHLTGNRSEYTVRTTVSAGSCNIGNQTGTTDKTVEINVSAGSTSVQFLG